MTYQFRPRARPATKPFGTHSGSAKTELRRHKREAKDALRAGADAVKDFGKTLVERVANTKTLSLALAKIARSSNSPVPDGLRPRDLLALRTLMLAPDCIGAPEWAYDRLGKTTRTGDPLDPCGLRHPDSPISSLAWNWLSDLSKSIPTDFQAAEPRAVMIPKASGTGLRPIAVQNLDNRVVDGAIALVLGPLLDPTLDDRSFGFRPGRDRSDALITWLGLLEEFPFYVAADIRDAFGSVSQSRLMQLFGRFDSPELVDLLGRAIQGKTKSTRGLLQGSPLSPMLLNVYLDHFVDGPWRLSHPSTPLLRYADDLLIACRSREEAVQKLEDLGNMLRPHGMALKDGAGVFDVRNEWASWLGYSVRQGVHGPMVRISPGAWSGLGAVLRRAYDQPHPPLVAEHSVRCWLNQLGPAFAAERRGRVIRRVVRVCREHGFSEGLSRQEVLDCWRTTYARWCRHRAEVEERRAKGAFEWYRGQDRCGGHSREVHHGVE